MRENQFQIAGVWCNATRTVDQRVAGGARTRIRTLTVGAQLIAVAPFIALVQIQAGPVVIG